VRTFLPGEVADFDGKIVEIIERLKAIPQPFDQAIIGDDETPSRQVILAAVESLEDFAAMMSHLDHAVLALEKE